MPSTFLVTLDRTAPPLSIEVEQGPEPSLFIVKLTTGPDATEYRLWGTIDPTDPITNADFAENEGDAEWHPLDTELLVRVAPGDVIRLEVQTRDDVWNESETAVFKVGQEAEPEPTRTPGWPQPPKRTKQKPRRVFTSTSTADFTSTSSVERVEEVTFHSRSRTYFRSTSGLNGRRFIFTGSLSRVITTSQLSAAVGTRSEAEVSSESALTRTGDSFEDEAAIIALLLNG